MKRFLAALTALTLTLGAGAYLPGVQNAVPVITATAETYGDYEYTVLDGGTVEITGYMGSDTVVEIPAVIEEKAVTSIGDWAFSGQSDITEITIPESVISIKTGSFYSCSGLTKVTIPNSVTSIGGVAFNDCSSLAEITIPDGVTVINSRCFCGCSSLTEITIPNGVTEIGYFAFENCTGLKKVNIPESVVSIWDKAFHCCTGLTEIELPEGLERVGGESFSGCTGLTKVVIPDSVKILDSYAFCGCTDLTEVSVSDQGKTFAATAFWGCTSLTHVDVFHGNSYSSSYDSEDGVVYGYRKTSLKLCPNGKESISIPDSVLYISSYSLSNCTGLTEITIPSSVKSISDYALLNCSGLKEITIPKSVEEIGEYALGYSYDLETYQYSKLPGFTIYCCENTAAHKYAIDNEFDFVLLTEPAITGEISSGNTDLEDAQIFFTSSDGAVIRADVDGAGFSADIPAGEYTVKVSKDGYAPREYTVTVSDKPVELDVEIHKYGDINGSGDIDAKDIAKAIDVSKGNSTFRNDYDSVVADVDGKSGFSAGDTAAFIAHGKGVKVIG